MNPGETAIHDHLTRCVVWLLLAVIVVSYGGCVDPLTGLFLSSDTGTVIVRVTDEVGTPLPNIDVEVGGIPNNVGSTYAVGQRTGPDGMTSFDNIPAGTRAVGITVPMGFVAGPEGVVRQVDVVKNASVTVVFRIVRQ